MEVNSLLRLWRPTGWMASTWFSAKLSKDWRLCRYVIYERQVSLFSFKYLKLFDKYVKKVSWQLPGHRSAGIKKWRTNGESIHFKKWRVIYLRSLALSVTSNRLLWYDARIVRYFNFCRTLRLNVICAKRTFTRFFFSCRLCCFPSQGRQ